MLASHGPSGSMTSIYLQQKPTKKETIYMTKLYNELQESTFLFPLGAGLGILITKPQLNVDLTELETACNLLFNKYTNCTKNQAYVS